MSKEKFHQEIFEKIHNINQVLNRRLGWLIYLGSVITVFLLLILPYSGRVALAFLINVLFNRPLVYLNYVARYIAAPLSRIQSSVFYFLIFGVFAILFRIFSRSRPSGWIASAPSQKKGDFRFQS